MNFFLGSRIRPSRGDVCASTNGSRKVGVSFLPVKAGATWLWQNLGRSSVVLECKAISRKPWEYALCRDAGGSFILSNTGDDVSEVLGLNLAVTNYGEMVERCVDWARKGQSRSVFFANVHVVMEAYDDPSFQSELNQADLVCPDGTPLVWALKALGNSSVSRVYGPDATEELLAAAEMAGLKVGFYGGSEEVLRKLGTYARKQFPALAIVFEMSPPFRELLPDEDEATVQNINASGVQMLFVGLGCPKQEKWIRSHSDRLGAVLFGVGAAFDFLAGTKPQAPRWMMRSGLEWIFRFSTEPKRLAGRYAKHNPRFLVLIAMQIFGDVWKSKVLAAFKA